MQSVAWGNHSHPSNPYYSRKSVLKIVIKKCEQTFVLFRLVYILKQAKKQIQTSIQNSPNKPTPKNLPKFRAKKICVLRLRPPLNVKLGNFTLKLKLCSDSNVMYCKVCCACKVVLLMKPTAFLTFSLPSWSLMPKAFFLPICTGTGDQAIY